MWRVQVRSEEEHKTLVMSFDDLEEEKVFELVATEFVHVEPETDPLLEGPAIAEPSEVEFDGEAVGEPLNATELARVKGRLTPEMKAKLRARAKLLANNEADDAELKSLELEEQLEAERQAELEEQVRAAEWSPGWWRVNPSLAACDNVHRASMARD